MKKLFLLIVAVLTLGVGFAQSKLELAKQAIEKKDYDAVIQYTTDQLKITPKNADAYAIRVLGFLENGNFKEALSDANMAITYWDKKCEYKLGTLYCLRAAVHEGAENDASALADYNLAVKKDKKNPIGYSSRGAFYYKHGDYQRAEADFRTAYNMDKMDTDALLGVSRCLLKEGKTGEATVILDSLIKYEPMLAEAKRIRAIAYFNMEDYRAFVDMYIAYLSLENGELDMLLTVAEHEYAYVLKAVTDKIKNTPEDGIRYYWLGIRARVYQVKKQYNEALTDLHAMQAMLADTTMSSFILYQSAECYYELYEYSEALELYSKLLEVDSESQYAIYYRFRQAQCYAGLGKHQQAISGYSYIIENNIEAATYAYYGRGIIKEALKDFEGALDDYNKGLLLDEQERALLIMRGRILLNHKQDTVRATADFNKVLELDTIPVNSYRHYALLFTGRTSEAIEWNQRVLDLNPNAGNYYDAACLYALLGRKQEAVNYLKQAFEEGYRDYIHVSEDSDLDSIRDMDEYKKLLAKYRKEKIQNLFNKLP